MKRIIVLIGLLALLVITTTGCADGQAEASETPADQLAPLTLTTEYLVGEWHSVVYPENVDGISFRSFYVLSEFNLDGFFVNRFPSSIGCFTNSDSATWEIFESLIKITDPSIDGGAEHYFMPQSITSDGFVIFSQTHRAVVVFTRAL